MDYGAFSEMFVFVCFSLLLLLSLFSLVFISGQNFIGSSKDAATSAAVVELIIRKITVVVIDIDDCMLLTGVVSPINFYRAVVNSTPNDFS